MARMTKATEALYAERRAMCLELALQKVTYAAIAQRSREEKWKPAPYNSPQAVFEDVKVALKQYNAQRNLMAGEYLAMMLAELDLAAERVWRVMNAKHYVVNQGVIVYMGVSADDGQKRGWNSVDALRDDLIRNPDGSWKEALEDDKPVLEAVDRLIKISQERAKLTGNYAPVKKEIQVSAGGNIDERIAATLEQLGAGGQTAAAAGGTEAPVDPEPDDPGAAG